MSFSASFEGLNGDAIIIASGVYNPFSIVTDETTEFEDIIDDWNKEIEVRTVLDGKSCFVPVTDLFDSNVIWCTTPISFIRMQKAMKR